MRYPFAIAASLLACAPSVVRAACMPVTVANPVPDQVAPAGTAYAYTVPTDTFDPAFPAITYEADMEAGDPPSYGEPLPLWLSFDAGTGEFSGTPSSGDIGTYNLRISGFSGACNAEDLFTLTVSAQQTGGGTSGITSATTRFAIRKYYGELPSGSSSSSSSGSSSSSSSSSSGSSGGSSGGTPDTTAPTVATLSPADEADDAWTTANLVITFSETIAKGGSGTVEIHAASNGALVESIDLADIAVSDTGATINPASDLTAGTAYYVTVSAGAFTDTAGNPFAGISDTATWNFATAAAPQSVQEIAGSAFDWEHFVVDGVTYLALSDYQMNSKLYRFETSGPQGDGAIFPVQTFTGLRLFDSTAFVLNGITYLATANDFDSTGYEYNLPSTIYRFDPAELAAGHDPLVAVQSVMTQGAYDWNVFSAGGETYLFVSNSYLYPNQPEQTSRLYHWDASQLAGGTPLVEIQGILTHEATDSDTFTVDGTTYMLIANHRTGPSWALVFDINSPLYRFDPAGVPSGNPLVLVQDIPTHGAFDWEHFVINGTTFIILANSNGNAVLYEFDPALLGAGTPIVEKQVIPHSGFFDWEVFVRNGTTYLAAADYNGTSRLYRFDTARLAGGLDPMVEIQTFATPMAADWTVFDYGGQTWMFYANLSGNSKLFRFYP